MLSYKYGSMSFWELNVNVLSVLIHKLIYIYMSINIYIYIKSLIGNGIVITTNYHSTESSEV